MSRGTALELIAVALVVLAAVAAWDLAPTWAAAMVGAAVIGPWALRRARTRARWGGLSLLPVAAAAAAIALGAPLVPSTAAATFTLIALQRLGRTSPVQDRGLVPLTALVLTLAALVAPSPRVAVAIALWAGTAPVLGLLSALGPAPKARVVGRHLVPIAGLTAGLTLAIFLVIPRFVPAAGGLAIDPARARIGFSDEVTLGDLGELLDDARPALRLAVSGGTPTQLIRGLTLDRFDGQRWTSTAGPAPPPVRPADAIPVVVEQNADAGPVAFAPGTIAAIEAPEGTFLALDDGSWRLLGTPRAVRYTAWLDPRPDPVPASARDRWLQLPDLDPRVERLASELTGGAATPRDAAVRIADHLADRYKHTLAPRDRATEAPLSTFLFETRAGHCEYFATAAAVLLRVAGHPARVVHGYARPDPVGPYWIVRHGHAHAWIEVLDSDGRWIAVDVTPGGPRQPPPPPAVDAWLEGPRRAFADLVVSYDASDQIAATAAAARGVQRRLPAAIATPATSAAILAIAVALVGLGLALGARHLARRLAGEGPTRLPGAIGRLHARARRDIRRAGFAIPTALPPVEAAAWLKSRNLDAGAALEALAWLHYRVRYGGESDAALTTEARARAGAVRRAVRRRHNGLRGSSPGDAPR